MNFCGWKIEGEVPEIKKFVAIAAPHTSNWDFVLGRLLFYSLGIKPKFLMKKELFIFPLGCLLKKMGGIPVDRNNKSNITDQLVEAFNNSEYFILTITPEGTRKKVSEWKKGFYNISVAANVPIVPGYFDYSKKVIGIEKAHFPASSFEAEMEMLKRIYQDVQPKFPKQFSI